MITRARAAGRHWGLWEARRGSWRWDGGTERGWGSDPGGSPTLPSAASVSSRPGPPPTVAAEKGAAQNGHRDESIWLVSPGRWRTGMGAPGGIS